jgi:hypothetical protein
MRCAVLLRCAAGCGAALRAFFGIFARTHARLACLPAAALRPWRKRSLAAASRALRERQRAKS